MMDIPGGNVLPDPDGGIGQPAYPWRGRITCHPAIGQAETADRTAAARSQIEALCGEAEAADFATEGTRVEYRGPVGDEGYRRFVLHYAKLAVAAGGVNGFVLGSEMRGLTRVRDEAGRFPFVDELVRLAGDVSAIVGPQTGITYAADWSEYFGYQPADGSGDVFFNLDPLWMAPAITAVGIDNYMPLSDWRDGDLAAGNPDGFRTQADRQAMRGQIAAGEGYDWFYASAADRQARIRTPISDGAAGKPWVFRFKDLEGWWDNPHHPRIGGVERAEPTAWVPRAKPFWFTELGCPAIDKGANQPNVFPDAKSSEGDRPYFSTGARADLVQRRFLEAHLAHWSDAPAGMVDTDRIFLWAWDARPYPAFPANVAVWSDGANWQTGHWLNGRLGALAAADLVGAVLEDHNIADHRADDVAGDAIGYVQGEPASARQTLEPLLELLQVDVAESGGTLVFASRTRRTVVPAPVEAVIDDADEPLVAHALAQESEMASEAVLDHFDANGDYEPATARSRRLSAGSRRRQRLSLPIAMDEPAARAEIDLWLRDHWAGRGTVRFALPPSALAIEAGDVVSLPERPGEAYLVTRVEEGRTRRIEARGFANGFVLSDGGAARPPAAPPPSVLGWAPIVHLMDLPVIEGADETAWARAAAYSRPWRPLRLLASAGSEGFEPKGDLPAPARLGVLLEPLEGGVAGRFDRHGAIRCRFYFGAPASRGELATLNGENVATLRTRSGAWEILQFAAAEETAIGEFRLTQLLRGQAGTEDAMAMGADEGAEIVLLDSAVAPLALKRGEAGMALNWRAESTAGQRAVADGEAIGLRALTPLSPVHLTARRLGNGDIRIGWIRRGRFDADGWLAPDIPLDAPVERYRVEILDGATVRRTAEVGAPVFDYAAASETADFGGPQTALAVRVRQMGGAVPFGLPATRTIPL